MLPQEIEKNQQEINSDTQRYLETVEVKLYADIEQRKKIDNFLLFIACQMSSCSISWLLFYMHCQLHIISIFSILISLTPGLLDLQEFNANITSENWSINLGKKPIQTIAKFVIGFGFSHSGTQTIALEIEQTKEAINQTYSEIKNHQQSSWQIPDIGFNSLCVFGLIATTYLLFNKLTKKNE